MSYIVYVMNIFAYSCANTLTNASARSEAHIVAAPLAHRKVFVKLFSKVSVNKLGYVNLNIFGSFCAVASAPPRRSPSAHCNKIHKLYKTYNIQNI